MAYKILSTIVMNKKNYINKINKGQPIWQIDARSWSEVFWRDICNGRFGSQFSGNADEAAVLGHDAVKERDRYDKGQFHKWRQDYKAKQTWWNLSFNTQADQGEDQYNWWVQWDNKLNILHPWHLSFENHWKSHSYVTSYQTLRFGHRETDRWACTEHAGKRTRKE